MGPLVTILVILILVLVILAVAGIAMYNGLIRLRNVVTESWRQVDVELNRRYELIPNLVETVRGFAAHERNTLEGVIGLRNQAVAAAQNAGPSGAPTAERAQVESQLGDAVRQLMINVEAYPDLKSDQNFLELQRQLAETEDRIAAGRRYYNANVRAYNTKIESVPTNLIAGAFKFETATYFEVNDAVVRQAPNVSFGEIAYDGKQPSDPPPREPLPASNPSALPNPQQAPQQQVPQQQAPQPQWPTQSPPAQRPTGFEGPGRPQWQAPQPGPTQPGPAQPGPAQSGQPQWPPAGGSA